MSSCSNTLRALSYSRTLTSRTLLPFLYQTATIQQRQPGIPAFARRNISSRSNTEDDIPFEDLEGNLPPKVDETQSARKTTITGNERAAFEKLYKTFNTQGQARSKKHEELDQIADEYYEDDEEGLSKSLDKVFDAVLKGSPRSDIVRRDRKGTRTKKTGETGPGKEISVAAKDAPKYKMKLAERERVKKLRIEERNRVDQLLKSAKTDQQLWSILDREVFEQLRKLDLDSPKPKKESHTKSKPHSPAAVDTRILFPNYPLHLITAIQTLRTHFPTSTLPLTLLPTIKSLGRSAYALGATTQFYEHLLRTAWLQQSSYTLIETLLNDMETNIVEFDIHILDFLDSVIKEHEMARNGWLGREMQMVYGMEMWIEGTRKMKRWREVVAERLGVVEKEKVVRRPERYHQADGVKKVERGFEAAQGTEFGHVIPFVRSEQTAQTRPARDAFDQAGMSRGANIEASAEQSRKDQVSDEDMDTSAKVLL